MAPIKFEEQLKDKLERRTLSPSAEGWSKLSDRLDIDKNKSKSPMYWWLSIAAGLVVLLAVSIQFFNTTESEELIPQVVEEVTKEEVLENQNRIMNKSKDEKLATEDFDGEDDINNSPNTKESQILDYKKVTNKKTKVKNQLAEENQLLIDNENINKENQINKEVQELLSTSQLKSAVAKALNELSTESSTVTDKEIDSLLKVASKELFKDELRKESSVTVDANALLMSVQDDMGQSFRSKVFEALKGSYNTVKTAVADRKN